MQRNPTECTVTIPLTHSLQLYPDRYKARGRSVVTVTIAQTGSSGVAQYFNLQFVGNSLINNYAVNGGSFSGNSAVPSGIAGLLGSTNPGSAGVGAYAPYSKYRITAAVIRVRYVPDSTSTNATSVLSVFPNEGSAPGDFNGMTLSQVAEQAYVVTTYIPQTCTTAPQLLKNSATTLRVFGDKFKSTIENGLFDGVYNGAPTAVWQFVISLNTIATVANYSLNGTMLVEVDQDIEFFDRNTLRTTLPA